MLLCRFHHRHFHKGQWEAFIGDDGHPSSSHPPRSTSGKGGQQFRLQCDACSETASGHLSRIDAKTVGASN